MDDKTSQIAFRVKVLSAVAMKLARQDVEKRLQVERIDISPAALVVLRFIKHDHCTICELGRKMMIAPATLVPVVDSLAEKGLLKRGNDPKDRRRNPLLLTPKGSALLARVPAVAKDDLLVKCIAGMGENKSMQLVRLLEEMVTSLSGDEAICRKLSDVAKKEHGKES